VSRLRGALLGVLVAGVLAAGTWAVFFSPLCRVERVVVRGGESETAAIARLAVAARGRSLLALDTRGVIARLETLPDVESARLTRVWPHEVVVTVRFRRAVAVLGRPAVAVDASGRLLGPLDSLPAAARPSSELPRLTGVSAGNGGRLTGPAEALVRLAVLLERAVPNRLVALGDDHGEVVGELRGGLTVRFGGLGAEVAKAVAVRTVLARLGAPAGATLDVSVPDRPTLTLRGAST